MICLVNTVCTVPLRDEFGSVLTIKASKIVISEIQFASLIFNGPSHGAVTAHQLSPCFYGERAIRAPKLIAGGHHKRKSDASLLVMRS